MLASTPAPRNEQQDRHQRPLLPSIKFLKTHFEQGGVEKKGHTMLYNMIEMMSAIAYEVYAILQYQHPRSESVANMLLYCKCILEGCEAFNRNMVKALQKASDTLQKLPDIEKHGSDGERETKIKQWHWKLKTLHQPTGNDIRLFELIYIHHHDHAYERVVTLHRKKPEHQLGDVVARAGAIDLELHELVELARQADSIVSALDDQFNEALSRMQESAVNIQEMAQLSQFSGVCTATAFQPPKKPAAKPSSLLIQSFGAAEEEIFRRGHARAMTVSETEYAAAAANASVAPLRPTCTHPVPKTAIVIRRKGSDIPRVFVDSLHELESDVRELGIDKVKTPGEESEANLTDSTRVSGLRRRPAVSRSAMLSLASRLPRGEALFDRGLDVQNRVIASEAAGTRAPFRETRAQTVHDSVRGLEEWLKEKTSEKSPPCALGSTIRRGKFRDRDNTL